MALAGEGVLAIWNGISQAAESEFLKWHMNEHIPERVAVPGFLRGRRYVAFDGWPKYFNFYETQTWQTLTSPAYLERLNAPSEWTKAVVRHFEDTSRTICAVADSRGLGDGAWIATFRLATERPRDEFIRVMGEEILEPVMSQASVIGVHLLEGQRSPDDGPTAEKALRNQPDAIAQWILLIEAAEAAPLQHAQADACSEQRLNAAGAIYNQRKDGGVYRLQFALNQCQLRG